MQPPENVPSKQAAVDMVLWSYGIDPDKAVTTDWGQRRACDIMEAHIMAGIDEIEEEPPPDRRAWLSRLTDESRAVEEALYGKVQNVDAYVYNAASIRVRVYDERFANRTHAQRMDLIEPWLEALSADTRAKIVKCYLFTPTELLRSRNEGANLEFETASP